MTTYKEPVQRPAQEMGRARGASDMQAYKVEFTQSNTPFATEFQATGGTGYIAVPGIALSAISEITGRALQAPLSGKNAAALKRARDVHPDYTSYDFWRSLFEAVLTHKGVLLYNHANAMRFSTVVNVSLGGEENGVWEVTEFIPSQNNTVTRRIPYDQACMIRWSSNQGQDIFGQCPLDIAAPAIVAYNESLALLQDYARHSNKISTVLSTENNTNDPERALEFVKSVSNQIAKPGHYRSMYTDWGFKMDNLNQPTPPALQAALDQATIAIARAFKVPEQMLGILPTGTRTPVDEIEDTLVRKAVRPLLENIAAAVSKVVGAELMFDTTRLGLPGFVGMGKAMKDWAQSGLMTRNMILERAGFEPLPEGMGGDEIPEPAGSGKQGEDNEDSKSEEK